jgi:Phosphorylase superfamily
VILVCAATAAEARACREGLADAGARDAEVLRTGVGPARAGAALARRLARGPRPDLVVSSGFAGALTPDVALGAFVTASAVVHVRPSDGAIALAALPRELIRVLPGALPCRVVTAGAVLREAPPGIGGPIACDMESAALADAAGSAGVPFAVLRMITDAPGAPLAPLGRLAADALAAAGPAARALHAARLAAEAVLHPAATATFVRESIGWCRILRAGWRERAGELATG